jgi:transposase
MHRYGHAEAKQWPREDRRRLLRALRQARRAREYRRIEMLLWMAEGVSLCEAARRGHVDRASVARWRERYWAERDVAALTDRPRSGRPALVPELTNERLDAILAQDPRACGYQATGWTVPLLMHHLEHCHGWRLSDRTLRQRLHDGGYRWKRPRYVFSRTAPHLAQKKGGSSAG